MIDSLKEHQMQVKNVFCISFIKFIVTKMFKTIPNNRIKKGGRSFMQMRFKISNK